MLRACARQAPLRLRCREPAAPPFPRCRASSSQASSEASGSFTERIKAWVQSDRGQTMIGNFSYVLQFAGFMCTDVLPMRSFLIGGSMSFVCYALIQPKKLWIPAIWESTFASIHVWKIYELMCGDRIALSPEEMKLYGLLFGHHHLDPHAFRRLIDIGKWAEYQPGETLTTEGKHVEKVRVLISGNVAVHHNEELLTTLSNPGHFMGEMSLMQSFIHLHDEEDGKQKDDGKTKDWSVATATLTTKDECKLFEWPTEAILKFLDEDQASGILIKAFFEDVMVKLSQSADNLASQQTWRRLRHPSSVARDDVAAPAGKSATE